MGSQQGINKWVAQYINKIKIGSFNNTMTKNKIW